ncbi:hypothetical protein Pmani_028384 [Petrolisthes manimaculis]|uniref:Uncharacterized protein n=1 Tax=Petrolisthes manimaculis TaxID=1843537 RepID=A0AAE1NZL4_9EUCA|nr:hypothetical protein Pmani_028384 [Petrolisthes manimaculis]
MEADSMRWLFTFGSPHDSRLWAPILSVVMAAWGILIGVAVSLYMLRKLRDSRWPTCKSKRRMDGKVVVVTGSNSGIGKETARDLAGRGAVVVLACRDRTAAQAAVTSIRVDTQDGDLIIMSLDLSDLDSIRTFASNFKQKFNKLDVLVNNAGLSMPPDERKKTKDGFEINFGVNHLGHFLLTHLLTSEIKDTPNSRIVNVSSQLYVQGKLDFDNLDAEKGWDPKLRNSLYCTSKLANILHSRELARRLKGTSTGVFALSPGFVATGLFRYSASRLGWMKRIAMAPVVFFMMRSARKGAQSNIYCAVSEDLDGVEWAYVRDCKQSEVNEAARDPDTAARLWEVSMKLVGEAEPGSSVALGEGVVRRDRGVVQKESVRREEGKAQEVNIARELGAGKEEVLTRNVMEDMDEQQVENKVTEKKENTPQKGDNIVLPKVTKEVVTPQKREDKMATPRMLEEVFTPKKVEEVASPPPQVEEVMLPKKVDASPPHKMEEVQSTKQVKDIASSLQTKVEEVATLPPFKKVEEVKSSKKEETLVLPQKIEAVAESHTGTVEEKRLPEATLEEKVMAQIQKMSTEKKPLPQEESEDEEEEEEEEDEEEEEEEEEEKPVKVFKVQGIASRPMAERKEEKIEPTKGEVVAGAVKKVVDGVKKTEEKPEDDDDDEEEEEEEDDEEEEDSDELVVVRKQEVVSDEGKGDSEEEEESEEEDDESQQKFLPKQPVKGRDK